MPQVINTLLYESKPRSLEVISNTFEKYYPEVKIINLHPQLKSKPPKDKVDLIILDIASDHDIKIAKEFSQWHKPMITVGQTEDLMKKLHEYDLLNCLLYPMNDVIINDIIAKVKQQLLLEQSRIDLHINHPSKWQRADSILIPCKDGFDIIHISEIMMIQADRAYCNIYLFNGKIKLISRPLRDIEAMLPPTLFFRVHKSYVVNLNAIERILKHNTGNILLCDGTELPIGKGKKDELVGVFGKNL